MAGAAAFATDQPYDGHTQQTCQHLDAVRAWRVGIAFPSLDRARIDTELLGETVQGQAFRLARGFKPVAERGDGFVEMVVFIKACGGHEALRECSVLLLNRLPRLLSPKIQIYEASCQETVAHNVRTDLDF